MGTLYVTEPGAHIEKEYQRLLVTKDDEVLLRTSLAQVSEVVLVGSAGVTTPALLALLDAGVGLALVSRTGELRGRLAPPTARNIPLRHRQYERAADTPFCLELSRAIVSGKLRNERTLARRLCRTRAGLDAGAIAEITAALQQVVAAPDLATLRGLEGAGARAYFRVFRQALALEGDPHARGAPRGMKMLPLDRQIQRPGGGSGDPPRTEFIFERDPSGLGNPKGLAHGFIFERGFEKRARRPPPDPVNAMLSLGYTLLGQNMMTALEVVGLDPYDGFFHADKYGRPALALDLMEEFRSVIVDSVVLTAVNKRLVDRDDFEPGPQGGVFLRPAALRKFLAQYSARLQTKVTHPRAGRRLTYQQCFEVQARLLRQVIEGTAAAYTPFLAR